MMTCHVLYNDGRIAVQFLLCVNLKKCSRVVASFGEVVLTCVYLLYCFLFSAVLLVLFNKAALSSYSFPCANVITLFQVDP